MGNANLRFAPLVLSFACRRAGDRGKPTELQAASVKLQAASWLTSVKPADINEG